MDSLILVNKTNKIHERFIPNNMIICDDNKYNFHNYLDSKIKPMIKVNAYYQFQELHKDASKEGFDIIVDSGYRSYNYQKMLWEISVAQKYKEMKENCPNLDSYEQFLLAEYYTNRFVAKAGYSEHQTGLAIDFAIYDDGEYTPDIEKTDESIWMSENAYKYGFILRYPKGKEKITGYGYEPWHYRYVGLPYSEEMYKDDLTLEEYHQLVLKK